MKPLITTPSPSGGPHPLNVGSLVTLGRGHLVSFAVSTFKGSKSLNQESGTSEASDEGLAQHSLPWQWLLALASDQMSGQVSKQEETEMTQGVPAWGDRGDDSAVKRKGQAGGRPWMVGISVKVLSFLKS